MEGKDLFYKTRPSFYFPKMELASFYLTVCLVAQQFNNFLQFQKRNILETANVFIYANKKKKNIIL